MIKNIAFENFYSFLERTEVSFEVGKKPRSTDYDLIDSEGNRVNKVVSVLGGNGSGKTSLLKPLPFLTWFLNESISIPKQDDIPYHPHALRKEDETTLEVFFEINETDYHYKLVLLNGRVKYEELRKKTSRLYSYVFQREISEGKHTFKQKSFGFREKNALNTRDNVSILCTATQLDVPIATEITEYFSLFYSNIHNSFGRYSFTPNRLFDAAEFFYLTEQFTEKMSETLATLDLGLSGVEIQKKTYVDDDGKEEDVYIPIGVHHAEGKEFALPFYQESSGTQSAFVLLACILPVLEIGSVAIIDELDNDLHPHMLPVIIDWFANEDINKHGAQLIFSCHVMDVLNKLQKHQVYLTEKVDCCSESWRLDEIEGLRSDDNLYAKYYSGALGGVPNFS